MKILKDGGTSVCCKRLSGSLLRLGDLRNCINVPELNDLPPEDLANSLNGALLEPLQEYRLDDPLVPLPLEDAPEFLEVPEHQVYQLLCKLIQTKPVALMESLTGF